MRLWPKSLKWRAILLTMLVTASSLSVACVLNLSTVAGWANTARHWVEDQHDRQKKIDQLKHSEHAFHRDLARGEFGRGSSAEEWFAKHPPSWCARHDNYITAFYETEERIDQVVVAQDGKLVSAHISWTLYDFFTFRTEADENDYVYSFRRWHQGYCATMPAVLGVAAVSERIYWTQFPQPTDD